jgi:hypothetical protein
VRKTNLAAIAAVVALLSATRPLRPAAAEAVTWTDLVYATVTDGVLLRSSVCGGCPGGARSVQTIGTGGGYVEFTPSAGAQLFAGLGTQTASTAYTDIAFGFGFWPDGGWDIRESGQYRAEGRFSAGDRFKVSIESGTVKYYQNGALVFSSATAPAYPMVLDTTLLSAGAAIANATLAQQQGNTPPPPTAVLNPGPYDAIVDRVARPKPTTAAPPAAGGRFTDAVFGSRLLRVTDRNTRPAAWSVSYRSPSGSHQNAWSKSGNYFYVVSTDGAVVPFAFDRNAMTASRLNPSASGDGGLVLQLGGEPEFSFFDDSLFGVYNGTGANLRTIAAFDVTRGTYTPLLDLDTVVAGLTATYVGGVSASAGAVEKVAAFFGGIQQGYHHYAIVFERRNPAARHVVDTLASTVDGAPTNIPLNFRLHHSFMDKSGQFVMLYPPLMDQQAPRSASPYYIWNLATNQFTELPLLAARVGGHDGIGYGYLTNQDCCTRSTWDAAQWQIRSLATPFTIADLISPVLTPKEVTLADHQSWTHAEPGKLVPIISANYRFGVSTVPWRAWDEEIVAVQTDVAFAGLGAAVWRFAHHRSNVANDDDPSRISFWYTPRAIVSQDGRWAIFTSNWDKTLGTDARGEPGGMFRQDVFVVELKMLKSGPKPPKGVRIVS